MKKQINTMERSASDISYHLQQINETLKQINNESINKQKNERNAL